MSSLYRSILNAQGSSFASTNSFEFDGNLDFVETTSTYSELDGATALTISFWAKSTSVTTSNVIHIGQSPNRQVYIAIFSLGRITFVKDETNPTSARTNNSIFPHDSNWHHVMICVDLTQSVAGQRCRIFLDSNDVTGSDRQLDNTAVPTSTGNLYLNEVNKDFTGNIDEVAIWSGTDLRNNVADIYNNGVPNNLNDNGLTAPTTWYRMGEDATWDGREWNPIPDVQGSNDAISVTLPFAARTTDVPT
jgi:hypothetical protein